MCTKVCARLHLHRVWALPATMPSCLSKFPGRIFPPCHELSFRSAISILEIAISPESIAYRRVFFPRSRLHACFPPRRRTPSVNRRNDIVRRLYPSPFFRELIYAGSFIRDTYTLAGEFRRKCREARMFRNALNFCTRRNEPAKHRQEIISRANRILHLII